MEGLYPKQKSKEQSILNPNLFIHLFIRMIKVTSIYGSGRQSKEIETNLVFDLFNKEGYYLYEVESLCFPVKIKNGYLYTVKADPDTRY